jgi:hypothetical protein
MSERIELLEHRIARLEECVKELLAIDEIRTDQLKFDVVHRTEFMQHLCNHAASQR